MHVIASEEEFRRVYPHRPQGELVQVHQSNYEVYNKEGAHSENLIVLL